VTRGKSQSSQRKNQSVVTICFNYLIRIYSQVFFTSKISIKTLKIKVEWKVFACCGFQMFSDTYICVRYVLTVYSTHFQSFQFQNELQFIFLLIFCVVGCLHDTAYMLFCNCAVQTSDSRFGDYPSRSYIKLYSLIFILHWIFWPQSGRHWVPDYKHIVMW
jgi:hypothetical protein